MAKQTKTENQDIKQNVQNPVTPNSPETQTDAFGENQETQNPYTKTEPVLKTDTAVESVAETPQTQVQTSPVIVEESKTDIVSASTVAQTQDIIQPTIQDAPAKPTLTDQEVYEDFSADSTVKVENANGVTVKLSGTAAQILKGLDATTKIV